MILFGAVCIAFWDVLGSERGLFFRDHILVFKPRWWAVTQALGSGHLPLLTRASTEGVPLEHLLNATYTPATLIFALAPFEVAYDWFVLLHFVHLGGGVYGLAHSLGARPPEALAAASVAALAGPVLSTENLLVALQSLAWAPYAYWALSRVFVRPSLANTAALALAFGLRLQGIEPVQAALDVSVFAGLALWLRPQPCLRLIGAGLAATVLGIGLASVELMPVLQTLSGTERGAGFSYAELSGWALNPGQIVELFAPSLWAPPEVPFLNPAAITGNPSDPPYFTSIYLGASLALIAALGGRTRAGKVLLVAVLLAAVVAMGKNTPLHRLAAELPLLRSGRYAIKYLFLATAGTAALSALAIRNLSSGTKTLVICALIQAGVVGAFLVVTYSPELEQLIALYLGGYGQTAPFIGIAPADFSAIAVEAMRPRLAWAMFGALALAIAALLAPRLGARAPWVLAGVLALDLGVAGAFSVRGANIAAQELDEAPRALLGSREYRFLPETPQDRLPSVRHQEGHTYFEDMIASAGQRARHSYRTSRRYLDIGLDGQSNPFHERVFRTLNLGPRPDTLRGMARVGVRNLTSWSPDIDAPLALTWEVAGEEPEHAYVLPNVTPYVSAYTAWWSVEPAQLPGSALYHHLTSAELADVALLLDAPDIVTSTGACSRTEVKVEHALPSLDRIEARVDAPCEVLVVALEPNLAGWAVTVDGAPARLLQAEAGFLAVRVPAGAHAVVFTYEGLSRPWWPVSLGALVVILAMAVTGALRRRRTAP